MEPVEIIAVGNTLGEGVLWNVETQSLWWTDIQEYLLYWLNWESRAVTTFPTPERVGSFGFVAGERRLVVAFESGFALFDPDDGGVTWLERPAKGLAGMRFNDGRVDRQGRFWAGTMAEDGGEPRGKLYCQDGSGLARQRESGIAISNGICWSPDSTRFYFADSPTRTMWVYDFDGATGAIANRRVFATTPQGASPDGANVDAEGFVWSAQWGAGRVVRFRPDGTVDHVLNVPASQPTCIAFGGPDLDLLFVTSAREGLDRDTLARQPHAGDVFVYKVDVKGLPDRHFTLSGEG